MADEKNGHGDDKPTVLRILDFNIWGIIPTFLHADDPRPVREQFNSRYIGGWNSFPGFKLDAKRMRLKYSGDPPMFPLDDFKFRDEHIYIYPYSWVLVVQKDKTWEIARMD